MAPPAQDYLRLSVTDRCDFRCRYCLPDGPPPPVPRREVLSYEEHFAVACAAHSLTPLAKVRLTGGEPLLRRDLSRLVALLATLRPRPTIVLTTHALYLEEALPRLVAAGLDGVNVSLDHPDPAVFADLTGGADLGRVLGGLRAAKAAGLAPLRINAVVARSTLPDLPALLELAVREGADLRLIEMMPFGGSRAHWECEGVAAPEIHAALAPLVEGEEMAPPATGAGPARDWRVPGTGQVAGVIAAYTDPGCGRCSRLRLSSTGRLAVCLYQVEGADLKPYLRPLDKEGLAAAIAAEVAAKRTHNPRETGGESLFSLSEIGG